MLFFRYPEAFELSTCKKDNREYLFAASTPQERKSWMVALAKVRVKHWLLYLRFH